MADYTAKLRSDLAEQFKGKPVIDALLEAVGEQLTALYAYFEELRTERSIQNAAGRQLDGVGDIAALSRKEAGELACLRESVYVLDDEAYRQFLVYKIWRNTCSCTYADIIKAFRMFWDKPLYYKEDPDHPATLILESSDLSPQDDVSKLLNAPFIKPAGVTLRVFANTVTPEMSCILYAGGAMGRGFASTALPEIPLSEET